MSITFTDRQQHNFWRRVEKRGPDECWIWQGRLDDAGYGRFGVYGKVHDSPAQRFAWWMTTGDPGALGVLHRCDNPPCCNPAHLFLGTTTDNMRDRDQKGRQARGARHGRRTKPERTARGERHGTKTRPERIARGERHADAKLSEADVLLIRASRGETQQSLADRFGVSRGLIGHIKRRLIWRHL